jgi:hypothetical protein
MKPELNYRYHKGEIDDELPYAGELKLDDATGEIYDEDGDVLDVATSMSFCAGGDGRDTDEQ